MIRSRTYENSFIGFRNRLLQSLSRTLPGAGSLRVALHRRRGVQIGSRVFIGVDVIIDTSLPHKVRIGDDVTVGMRCTLIGHFGNMGDEHIFSRKPSLVIEDRCFIGPSVTILPNVTVGEGSVVMAGSVVTKSVRAGTMVQGNPATPVAKCGIPLLRSTPMWEFYRHLRPLSKGRGARSRSIDSDKCSPC